MVERLADLTVENLVELKVGYLVSHLVEMKAEKSVDLLAVD